MTLAILLVVCLVLAAAVGALGLALREVRERVQALEASPVLSPGFETGASAPSSTSGRASAPSSTSDRASAPSATNASLVEEVAQQPSRDHPDERVAHEFVITRIGAEPEDPPASALEARLFADVVLRETVVKAASFVYGVRRGLSPANRNRIWFEVRREVKRARKERKAEEREAVREWRARQRAAQRDGLREDDVA